MTNKTKHTQHVVCLEISICVSTSGQYCHLSWLMHCPHKLNGVIQIPGGLATECMLCVWLFPEAAKCVHAVLH